MQSSKLTHTLSFGLDIDTGSGGGLQTGCLEARRIRNETNRLDRAGWGRPYPYIDESYPMVMNHGEGYRLFPEDDKTVRFRITATRGTHVKGELRGSPAHFDRLQTAFTDDDWRVGTAEVVHKHNEWRLHVTVTHETHQVASKHNADTIVGGDVNEDCIALAALSRAGEVKDSVVFEYPSVKEQRHEFFTKRKRMQKANQTAFETVVQTEERDYVHDCLHKISRNVVDWVSQFSAPVIVFEDLKDMRESIDYGTRMNRRLHSLPFAALQEMVSYKAAWEGVPSDEVLHHSETEPSTDDQRRDAGVPPRGRASVRDPADQVLSVSIRTPGGRPAPRTPPPSRCTPI